MTRLIWLGLLLTVPVHAAAPDWAMTAAKEEVPPAVGFGLVENSIRARYLSPGRIRFVVRQALKLRVENSRASIRFEWPFNSDTDRVIAARAWAVSPKGEVRSFRRDEFLDVSLANNLYWNSQRVLTFDGHSVIDLGGVVACEVEIERPTPTSEIAFRLAPGVYTVRTILEVTPPAGFHLQWNASSRALPLPAVLSGAGGLRWECGLCRVDRDNIPEGFLPNGQRVSVRAIAGETPATWAETAKFVAGIMQPRIEESEPIRTQARRLTTGRSERWERIRALTEFVQKDVVYLNIPAEQDDLAGLRPHPSGEVLQARYGDCKDKAALLVALLRAVGEDARILLVNQGAPQMIDERWPSLFFNHAIVGILNAASEPADWPEVNAGGLGRMVVFDPTDSSTPLGLLSLADQGGEALLVDANEGRLVPLPKAAGPSHQTERTLAATLSESGLLTVAAEEDLRGLPAVEFHRGREAIRAERMTEFLTRELESVAPSIRKFAWHEQWKESAASYRLNLQFEAAGFSRWLTDELLALNPQFFPLPALPAWKTAVEGMAQLASRGTLDHARIALPAGYRVEELPSNWDKQGAVVSCHIHYAVKAGVLECESEFSLLPGFYDRERYEAIRLFVLKFREAQRRPILLRRPAPLPPSPGAGPRASA